jgi:hypothetical protein
MGESERARKIKVSLDERTDVVDVRIFLTDSDGQRGRALGVANFDLQDLDGIIAKLTELAHELAVLDALNQPTAEEIADAIARSVSEAGQDE